MGNITNIVIIYLTVSVFLYAALVPSTSGGLLFGDDLISKWVNVDDSGGVTGNYNPDFKNEVDSVTGYGASGSTSGTSFFNFWDALQIFWDIAKMILNIIFSVPLALLNLGIASFMKLFILIMVVVGMTVFVLGMMNKR